ncbi:MAG: M48 family metallopeptidase [Myxococcales bacterium]|nr:M48 family metallopeptidase [Myxococcales bacterium]
MAAGAMLSVGQPVDGRTLDILRATMIAERVPSELMAFICDKCAVGLCPEDVPVDVGFPQKQASLFTAAVILFALRATPHGDPLDVAARLCAPYRVKPEFISAFARELSANAWSRRSDDTAASLRLLLDPPEMLVDILRRYQGEAQKARRERRGVGLIAPRRIQHGDDRKASDALRAMAGFDDLVGFVMEHALETWERVANVGGKVRVGPNQLPELYELYRGCVARSGVTPEPELYIEDGPINAYTFGTDRPFIVLHSMAIAFLSTAELEFILGHELGHIRFEHVLYQTLGRLIPRIASQLPFGEGIAGGLDLLLYEWSRKAELSADRMGLLVCQDPDAALSVMVKLSGFPSTHYQSVNVEAFLAQHQDFEALDKEMTGVIAKVLRSTNLTHPWTVIRAHEMRRWVQDGDYQKLLSADAPALPNAPDPQQRSLPAMRADLALPAGPGTPPPLDKPLLFECPLCRSVVRPEERACATCGSPVTGRDRFWRCGRCGVPGRPSHQFCESCGSPQPPDQR